MEQECTQFAFLILYHDSTGCGEFGDYLATDADTMNDGHCEVDLNKDCF